MPAASRPRPTQPPSSQFSSSPPPSFDVSPEVEQKLFVPAEHVRRFNSADMLVITLAGLVVVAQDALARDDQDQSILEPMRRRSHRARNTPDDNLDKSVFGEDVPLMVQQLRLHIGAITNVT